jgi:hypothetical protein
MDKMEQRDLIQSLVGVAVDRLVKKSRSTDFLGSF